MQIYDTLKKRILDVMDITQKKSRTSVLPFIKNFVTFSYSTPLLLGMPFTLREGATAIATARANALKIDSRQ